MMKKLFILLLAMLCIGCSSTATEHESEETLYFLFASPLSTHTLWLQAKEGMEDACNELEVHCDWKGPIKISTSDMVDVISTGLLKQADGIITQGVVNASLIDKGMAQGTPIVLVDSPILGAQPLTTISKDFQQQAELLLEDIEKKIGEHVYLRIGIQVSDKTFDLAKDQITAIEKVFEKHPGGYEIVSVSESNSDLLTSKNAWVKVYQQDSGMNIAINLAGENAIGCVEAKEYMDNQDRVLIYGVDDMEETIALLREGKIEGSIVTSFYQYGYDSVKILYDYIEHGKKPKEELASKLILVNKDNLSTYKKVLGK